MEDEERQEMKEPVLGTAPQVHSELQPLIDKENDFIVLGRTRGEHSEFGSLGLMDVGVVGESQSLGENHLSRRIMMDSQFPHIMFICGKRGSGKSYTLGIIAEELAKRSEGIGTVLIDPIGIFWSLKRENVSEKEIRLLGSFGLKPMGFENVRALTPLGYEEGMEAIIDDSFAIGVSEMSASDWCTVFDLDRFKAQGLLISDVIDKVRDGYIALYGSRKIEMTGKEDQYSIGDVIQCIEHDEDFQSKKKGYASQTRRSVAARFHAVGNWGLFSMEGTPLDSITSPNNVTVIDVSHPRLDNDKRALIVGILARKILEGRIQASKREEARSLGMNVSMEGTLPVTWLLIDEAHLILPKIGKTAASGALVEYAKLGRKPGCGLVLATQRPAATDDGVLSQVDMMISHNLALEEDMVSLRKRMPSKVPQALATSDFIRSIPVGMGLLADQKTQNRAMLVKFRPRQSYHSGKAAVPTAIDTEVDLGGQMFQAKAIPKFREDDGEGSILSPSLNIEKLLIRIDRPKEDERPIFVVRGDDIMPKNELVGAGKDGGNGDGTLEEDEAGTGENGAGAGTMVEGAGEGTGVGSAEDTVSDQGPFDTTVPGEDASKDDGQDETDVPVKESGDEGIPLSGKSEEIPPVDEVVEGSVLSPEAGDGEYDGLGGSYGEPREIGTGHISPDETDAGSNTGADTAEPERDDADRTEEIPEMMRDVMERGHHFLFKNSDRTLSQQFVSELTRQCGIPLMVISRSPAARTGAVFRELAREIYWLSKAGKTKSLNPHNLEKITFRISRFFGSNPGSLVYFDGLEYLISNNDFQKVMRFIETVHEKCQLLDGVIVFPFTPEVVTKRDMTQLQTEMDVAIGQDDLLPFTRPEGDADEEGMENEGTVDDKDGLTVDDKDGLTVDDKAGPTVDEEEDEILSAAGAEVDLKEGGSSGSDEDAREGPEETVREEPDARDGVVAEPSDVGAGAHVEGGTGEEPPEVAADADMKGEQGEEPYPGIEEDVTWDEDEEVELEESEEEGADLPSTAEVGREEASDMSAGADPDEVPKEDEPAEDVGSPGGLDTDYYDHLFRRIREESGPTVKAETHVRSPDPGSRIPGTSPQKRTMKDWPGEIPLHKDYHEMTSRGFHVTERDVQKIRVPAAPDTPVVDAEFMDMPVGALKPLGGGDAKAMTPPARKQKVVAPAATKRDKDAVVPHHVPEKEEVREAGPSFDFMEEVGDHLIIIPNISEIDAEEEATRYLESEGMFSRKKIEMISELNLTFLPLLRLTFTKPKMMSRKMKEVNLFFDVFTGELLTKFRKGLRRTTNMNLLFNYPRTQVQVLLAMKRGSALSDIELRAKTDLRSQDLKKALVALEKEGMLHRQVTSDGFYKYRRKTDITIPTHLDRATPDLPYIREGKLTVDALEPRYKQKDVEKLILSLADKLTFVDSKFVHYPYFMVSVEGKRGPRNIFIDGTSGEEDELLGTIKNFKMKTPP